MVKSFSHSILYDYCSLRLNSCKVGRISIGFRCASCVLLNAKVGSARSHLAQSATVGFTEAVAWLQRLNLVSFDPFVWRFLGLKWLKISCVCEDLMFLFLCAAEEWLSNQVPQLVLQWYLILMGACLRSVGCLRIVADTHPLDMVV